MCAALSITLLVVLFKANVVTDRLTTIVRGGVKVQEAGQLPLLFLEAILNYLL